MARLLLVVVVLPQLVTGPGCTRSFYRKWVDKDAEAVLKQKSDDPRWSLDGYHVLPDPRSRFADPSNPDKPPMPPDDPAAAALSPNPQRPGKAGVGKFEGTAYLELMDQWDCENRAEAAAREAAAGRATAGAFEEGRRAAAQLTGRELSDAVTREGPLSEQEEKKAIRERRKYLLKLEQCVELGLINSREYQNRRESLYLAALPVVLERFAFAPQLFAASTYFRERFGAGLPDGPVNRHRINSVGGFSQTFSTGALLLASFANRTVVNLGQAPNISVSTFSLDLIQPLLRGAGQAVTLEPLTQAERNLLYAVRDFARFRQEFFVFIAAGQPAFIPGVQAGVQAITPGTVSAPSAAIPIGFALANSQVPALVGSQVPPGSGARLSPINPSGATPQGYLSTVGEKALLVNQYRNLEALRGYLRRFRRYVTGGIVNEVQVGQVEQTILRSTDNLLSSQASYRISIDQFKQQLGLPMTLDLDLDDVALRPMFDQARRFDDISSDLQRLSETASDFGRAGEEHLLRERLRKLMLTDPALSATGFPARLKERWAEWEKLPNEPKDAMGRTPLDRFLGPLIDERDKLLAVRRSLTRTERDLPEAAARRLEVLDFEISLGSLERLLRIYAARPWKEIKKGPKGMELDPEDVRTAYFNAAYQHFRSLLEDPFRELRDRARRMWPELPPLCVNGVDLLSGDDETVLAAVSEAALTNRLDLMNQRAQLVDAWRKVRVAANSLMGVIDVQYHWDVSTPLMAARPLEFGYNRHRHQLIINAEAPFVRVAERNAYRAILIAYQQQRRALQQAEDNVLLAVRLDLRQLRAAATNYHKVQKRNVDLAYLQVDQALEAFNQPQAPTGPAAPPGLVGPPPATGGAGDPAALTQQLLQAQNSLLSAVNGLYNTWLNYLTTRMSLYRDLGIMPLDARGVWIDDTAACCPPASPAHPGQDDPRPGDAGPDLPVPRPNQQAAPRAG